MANKTHTYRHTVTGKVAVYSEDFGDAYPFFDRVEDGAKDRTSLSEAVEAGKDKAHAHRKPKQTSDAEADSAPAPTSETKD